MLFYLLVYINKFFSIFHSSDPGENIPSVVYRLLRNFRIKITWTTTRENLKSDPDYPTLKSICNFFEVYGIINYPLKLDEADLYDLDRPFIAHINDKGWKIILVYQINKKSVIYADSLKGYRIMSIHNFLEKWNEVVIVTEAETTNIEIDYRIKRADEIVRKTLIQFISMIFVTAILSPVFSGVLFRKGYVDPVTTAIYFAHIAGLILSVLLFRHELNIKTTFTEKLCHISTNIDCNAITKSKASIIFGSITWADAGIVYFAGGIIALSLFSENNITSLFTFLSICSLPYSLFSILYQWVKIKKWCPFCLSVQTVLLTEFLILLPGIKTLDLNTSIIVTSILIYSVVLIVSLQAKFLIVNGKEKDHIKINLLMVKRNPKLFIRQLESADRISISNINTVLVFGDFESEITVTVFLSPYCVACAAKFSEILNLIWGKNKVKVQLIFPAVMDDLSSKLLKKVFIKASTDKKNEALVLLEDWYKADQISKSKVLNDIKEQDSPEGFDEMSTYNQRLFQTGNINKVPTVLVNGFNLPAIYSLEDIRYHINVLATMTEEQVNMEV